MGTRWRQPFCACVVVYEALDGDQPSGLVIEHRCDQHAHLKPAAHFEALLAFNRAMSAATESD